MSSNSPMNWSKVWQFSSLSSCAQRSSSSRGICSRRLPAPGSLLARRLDDSHAPRLHADRFAHQGHGRLGLSARTLGPLPHHLLDRVGILCQLLAPLARRREVGLDLIEEELLGVAV